MATREFKFNKNELELVIEGNTYGINPFDERITHLQREFAVEAERISEKISGTDEDVAASIDLCRDFIDSVLGNGETAKIFENRSVSIYDLFDVVNYINDEIRAEREKRLTVYNKNPRYNTYKKNRRRYGK